MTPDRTETLPAPGDCSRCGADLADAADAGMSRAQVWDLPSDCAGEGALSRCRGGGAAAAGRSPPRRRRSGWRGRGDGPNVNAAAILLASEGNVPLQRTAMLMAALLGAPVSTGFVARALERIAQRLAAARFDEAMTQAWRDEDVLCGMKLPRT